MSYDWSEVEEVVAEALDQGAFPGAVLLVGRGASVELERAWGVLEAGGEKAETATIYDVASLTKPLVTVPCLLMAAALGRLSLKDPVSKLKADFAAGEGDQRQLAWARDRVTVEDLLCHRSGLPAWRPYYESLSLAGGEAHAVDSALDGMRPEAGSPEAKAAVVAAALAEPLVRERGRESEYSDVGFIILGRLLEEVEDMSFASLARERLLAPLGLSDSCFFDACGRPFAGGRADVGAPVGQDNPAAGVAPCGMSRWRGRVVCGEVSDDNAFAMGGAAGHAGLFSTARDLHALVVEHLDALEGKGRVLGADWVKRCWARPKPLAGARPSTWSLGWDGPAPKGSSGGALISSGAVGHLGYSGCSLWIDRERGVHVIMLTNRIHPDWDNRRIADVRPKLHDAVFKAVDGGK